MSDLLKIFIGSMLVDNVVFMQYLALCPFIGMTGETGKATGMGLATTFVIVLATAVTWPIYNLVMVPLGLQFLQTLFNFRFFFYDQCIHAFPPLCFLDGDCQFTPEKINSQYYFLN